jgi:single-stranded DNA-binding protein
MKNLNSILIEGELLDTPKLSTVSDSLERCTFAIGSGDHAPSVPIVAYGRLALRANELLDKGSSIRVVGRLGQDLESSATMDTFRLWVIAEHLEVKPALAHRAEVA